MTDNILDENMEINSFKAKGKNKRKKIIKTNDSLLEKNKEKYDKIKAKNEREKIRIKRYAIIWGLLTLNIILLIFLFYNFYYKLEKKEHFNSIKKCDSGYYMPEFNRGSQDCKKCTVENCEKCIYRK